MGLEVEGELVTDLRGATVLVPGCTLLTIGTDHQLDAFRAAYP